MPKKKKVKKGKKGDSMHMMEGGHMMKDSEMKRMMKQGKKSKRGY